MRVLYRIEGRKARSVVKFRRCRREVPAGVILIGESHLANGFCGAVTPRDLAFRYTSTAHLVETQSELRGQLADGRGPAWAVAQAGPDGYKPASGASGLPKTRSPAGPVGTGSVPSAVTRATAGCIA